MGHLDQGVILAPLAILVHLVRMDHLDFEEILAQPEHREIMASKDNQEHLDKEVTLDSKETLVQLEHRERLAIQVMGFQTFLYFHNYGA